MDAHRDPHLLVSSRLPDHPKLVELGSDSARWGWLVVLCEAKRQRPAGRFPSRVVLAHLLGRYAKYIPAYVQAGLLHEAPALCDRCRSSVGDVSDGVLVVHDWAAHQLRRAAAERQLGRRLRARNGTPDADERHTDVTPMSHKSHIDVTPMSRSERDIPVTPARQSRDANVTFSRVYARPLQSQSQCSYVPESSRAQQQLLRSNYSRGGWPGDSGGGGPGEGVRRRRRWSILVGAEP